MVSQHFKTLNSLKHNVQYNIGDYQDVFRFEEHAKWKYLSKHDNQTFVVKSNSKNHNTIFLKGVDGEYDTAFYLYYLNGNKSSVKKTPNQLSPSNSVLSEGSKLINVLSKGSLKNSPNSTTSASIKYKGPLSTTMTTKTLFEMGKKEAYKEMKALDLDDVDLYNNYDESYRYKCYQAIEKIDFDQDFHRLKQTVRSMELDYRDDGTCFHLMVKSIDHRRKDVIKYLLTKNPNILEREFGIFNPAAYAMLDSSPGSIDIFVFLLSKYDGFTIKQSIQDSCKSTAKHYWWKRYNDTPKYNKDIMSNMEYPNAVKVCNYLGMPRLCARLAVQINLDQKRRKKFKHPTQLCLGT